MGDAWVQFLICYYCSSFSCFWCWNGSFLILYPWAGNVDVLGCLSRSSHFVLILSYLILGLVYAWRKGALELRLLFIPLSLTWSKNPDFSFSYFNYIKWSFIPFFQMGQDSPLYGRFSMVPLSSCFIEFASRFRIRLWSLWTGTKI